MDIHNIDDYLDLQDQHQMNLLSTEEITSQPEGETEWHSAAVVDNMNNPFLFNGDSTTTTTTTTDWGLLQNQLDLHQGINFIGHGGILVSNNEGNNCITPDSLFKQPEINIEQPLTPVEKEEEKRVTRSKAQGRVNNNTTASPKKKKSRSKKLYCICQQPYNGKPMVQCDYCSEWYHCACVGFNPDQEDEKEDSIDWACKKCIEDQKVEEKSPTTESTIKSPKSTTNSETPKITITVPTRQTRSTRTQSRCLYPGCTNRTRADSYCSDVCARKDKESSSNPEVKDEEKEQPSKANTRKSRMKTSALSTGTATIENELTRPTRSTRRKSASSPENKKKKEEEEEYVKEEDDEEEDEPSEEEDEKDVESTVTTPDAPMSPSQMTEQENPVRRNVIKNISAILKTIIDAALTENNDLFEQGDDDPITRAETLAKSIENTMLEQLGDGTGKKQRTCGERYKSKFRSLLYNLKDKQNQVFQLRVITGDLSPLELVKMSSEDMANPELKSMSEVLRKTGLKNSVMKLDNTPIIKKTHKGDIIMVPSKDNDTHQNIYAEQMESLSSSNNNINAKINEPLSSPVTTTEEKKDSFSPTTTTDGSKVDPLDDILARIGIPAQDDHNSNKRGSLDTSGAEYTKKRKVTLDMEELLGDEDEEFRVEEVDTSELVQNDGDDKIGKEADKNEVMKVKGESSKETEDSLPSIWHGRINMPQVAEFEASARQIGGRILNEAEWTEVLSPTMWIEGRIPSERVTSYVTQNQYSTSREIVLLEIEPADGMTNPSQSQTLLKYLDSRKRYAVVGHNKKIVKDFYLIPLYKTQDIPDCLYVVRVEERERKCDLFLGVLVISKQSSAKRTPPIAHTATATDAGTTSSISNLPTTAAAAAAITSQYNSTSLPNYGVHSAGYPVPSYNALPQQPQYGYGYAASQSYNDNNTNQYHKPMYQQQQQSHQPPRYAPYNHQQQQGQGYRSRNGNHNNNNKNSSYGSSHYRPSY